MKHTIISIGEILWDLLPDKAILGGAPANLAYRLNELGECCFLVSRIGCDPHGGEALHVLESMGFSTEYIQLDDQRPTGSVVVEFDQEMNPDYTIIKDVAYDYIELTDALKELASRADCIAFGTLAQRGFKSRDTIAGMLHIATKAVKFLDVNLRKNCYTDDILDQSLQYADVLKINHHEAYYLGKIFGADHSKIPAITRALAARFQIDTILVTLEKNGVFLADIREGEHYLPGCKVNQKDPLGAGDAFSAAFIHHYLKRFSLVDACKKGNLLGALVATTIGATTPLNPAEFQRIESSQERNYDQSLMQYYHK